MAAPTNYAMIRPEARFGDDTVGPGLVEDLHNFYDKTDSLSDRAKCMEIIDSINNGNVGRTNIRRPHTAAPVVGGDHSKNFLSPYQTSYNRDYPLKQPIDTVALRPMTSQGFAPQMGPGPDTHYGDEFRKKMQRPTTPLRPGTASGNRANNPHPPQSFLVWKFPRGGWKESEGAKWNEELTDDKINQVHKRLCQSTYQTDYLGTPQGFSLKSAYQLPPDWKENIPYTLDSVQRYCYQKQSNPNELQVPTNRYGSNKKKQIPASGTIPTASSRHMHIRNRTTYDRHYNDNGDAVVQQVRDLGHKLGADALRKYYEHATGEDRVMAKNILEAYGGRRIPTTPVPPAQPPMAARPPSRPQSRMSYKSNTPASTPITPPYVPLPPAKDPNASQLAFSTYSPAEALRS
ncbi:Testis-expressed sequence 26 protein [Mactra antiquata]